MVSNCHFWFENGYFQLEIHVFDSIMTTFDQKLAIETQIDLFWFSNCHYWFENAQFRLEIYSFWSKNCHFRHKAFFGSKIVTFVSKMQIFDQKWYISVSMWSYFQFFLNFGIFICVCWYWKHWRIIQSIIKIFFRCKN